MFEKGFPTFLPSKQNASDKCALVQMEKFDFCSLCNL